MLRIKRPSGATIIAFMALFAVLGGTGYAASKITSGDIKNGTIRTVDMSSSAKRALKGNTGARGPQGIPGPQGAQGPAGAAAVLGTQVVEAVLTIAPGDVDGPQVFCPAGKIVVGTGFSASITHVGFSMVFGNSVGAAYINDTTIPVETRVQAICAPGSPSATTASASSLPSRSALRRRFRSELAKVRATR